MRSLILVAALVLGACSTVPNPINRDKLAAVEASYGITLAVASNYRNLYDTNPCTKAKPLSVTNYCAERDVVTLFQGADTVVQGALVRLRIYVRNNPTLDASAYINAALNAIADFRAIQVQYRVK